MDVPTSDDDDAPTLGEIAVSALLRAGVLGAFFAVLLSGWHLAQPDPSMSLSTIAQTAAFGALYGFVSVPPTFVELKLGSWEPTAKRDLTALLTAATSTLLGSCFFILQRFFIFRVLAGRGVDSSLSFAAGWAERMLDAPAIWAFGESPVMAAFGVLTLVRVLRIRPLPATALVVIASLVMAFAKTLADGPGGWSSVPPTLSEHLKYVGTQTSVAAVLVPGCVIADRLELRLSAWLEKRHAP